MREGSKRAAVISIMTANADKHMDEVIEMLNDRVGFKGGLREARTYYGNFVRAGIAPGVFIPGKRGRKPKNATLAGGTSTKPVVDRVTSVKSEDEIAAIRAANLERIRRIATKVKNNEIIENINIKEDHELREQYRMDNEHPSFVTHSEVNHIID